MLKFLPAALLKNFAHYAQIMLTEIEDNSHVLRI